MSLEYVANVISFCLRQAERIRALVLLDAALHALDLCRGGEVEKALALVGLAREGQHATSGVAWLEQTPLLLALRRRL
jgi:hypothetical protein